MKLCVLLGLALIADAQDVLPYYSLDAYVRDVKANIIAIAGRGSDAFVPPSADETPPVNQLRNALNARATRIAGSCNWRDDGLTAQNLCGTTNVGGRRPHG